MPRTARTSATRRLATAVLALATLAAGAFYWPGWDRASAWGLKGKAWVMAHTDRGHTDRPAEEAAAPAASPAPPTAEAPAVPAPANASEPEPPANERVVEAPSGEDTQAEPARPGQSIARSEGLHRAPDPLGLRSSAALVLDPQRGQVLASKNPDAVLPIASLTKMMTGLLLVESRLPLEDTVTITQDDVDRLRNSRSRLRVGTTLTRAEALHLALMSSENRAAHALARTWPGGMEAFVSAMNAKARALGMKNTHFVDPTGLSVHNQSTPKDLALLVAAASREPLLREYSTTPRHELDTGKRTLVYNNSNRLVKNRDWDIVMQKTGYIVEAGQCVAMRIRVEGQDLIVVLLDATDKASRSADAERIRRWAAAQHEGPLQHAGARPGGTRS